MRRYAKLHDKCSTYSHLEPVGETRGRGLPRLMSRAARRAPTKLALLIAVARKGRAASGRACPVAIENGSRGEPRRHANGPDGEGVVSPPSGPLVIVAPRLDSMERPARDRNIVPV
jgi:hypothetical protein